MSNGGAETPPARVVVTRRMRTVTEISIRTRSSLPVGANQCRMNGGTSTSSSEIPPSSPPPMLTVFPLVCTGTLTASMGSNSVELSLPALPGAIGAPPHR